MHTWTISQIDRERDLAVPKRAAKQANPNLPTRAWPEIFLSCRCSCHFSHSASTQIRDGRVQFGLRTLRTFAGCRPRYSNHRHLEGSAPRARRLA